MLCFGPGALLSARLLAVALAMALSNVRIGGFGSRIIQTGKLVYNETIFRLKPGRSGIHVGAVDRERLAGGEIGIRRRNGNERPEQVPGLLIGPKRARMHGRHRCGSPM